MKIGSSSPIKLPFRSLILLQVYLAKAQKFHLFSAPQHSICPLIRLHPHLLVLASTDLRPTIPSINSSHPECFAPSAIAVHLVGNRGNKPSVPEGDDLVAMSINGARNAGGRDMHMRWREEPFVDAGHPRSQQGAHLLAPSHSLTMPTAIS